MYPSELAQHQIPSVHGTSLAKSSKIGVLYSRVFILFTGLYQDSLFSEICVHHTGKLRQLITNSQLLLNGLLRTCGIIEGPVQCPRIHPEGHPRKKKKTHIYIYIYSEMWFRDINLKILYRTLLWDLQRKQLGTSL